MLRSPLFACPLALITIITSSRAATLTVTSTNDDGTGSLRQALATADASSDADSIVFDIPGAGPHTIRPVSPFPTIHFPVTIDATTQPGYAGKPLIELDGSLAGQGAWGFNIQGSPCSVRGFVINRFGGGGILLASAGGDVVQANFIGTDLAGTQAFPNGIGVFVYLAQGELIGGTTPDARNVISGNQQAGIQLGGNTSQVLGNFIGTDVTGGTALGNQNGGISVGGVGNEIGGTNSGAGNVISGNQGWNIVMGGTATQGNLVRGNYIGTDVNGTIALGGASGPGTGVGVFLWGADDNRIGEATAGGRNIISGNQCGIDIRGDRNVVEGNFIGVDVSGAVALPNQRDIGLFDTASDNRIGGVTPGAGNLISGNAGEGIALDPATASGTQILGNWIGVDSKGTVPIGNLTGIAINASVDTSIGGIVAGAGNTIANSSYYYSVLWNPQRSHQAFVRNNGRSRSTAVTTAASSSVSVPTSHQKFFLARR